MDHVTAFIGRPRGSLVPGAWLSVRALWRFLSSAP
jgi:hypothetical protein